jgi:hypothetical protein
MQIQQEQHAQNMQSKDLEQERFEIQNKEITRLRNKQLRNDIYDALTPAIEDGDLGMLRQVMKDPDTNALFGNVIDVRAIGTDSRDGEDFGDEVLKSLGIKDYDTLTPEKKQTILENAKSKDIVVVTNSDGSKRAISIAKLAGGMGYYGNKSKKDKDVAALMAQKGNLDGLYAHAVAVGNTEDAEKYYKAIDKLQRLQYKYKPSSIGGGAPKQTAAIVNAEYAVRAKLGPKATKEQIKQAAGEMIYKEYMTAGTKAIMEHQGAQQGAAGPIGELQTKYNTGDVNTTEALEMMRNPAIDTAVKQDRLNLYKDAQYKDSVKAIEGSVEAVESFGRFVQYADKKNVSKNILTEIGHAVSSKFSKEPRGDWSPEAIAKYEKDANSWMAREAQTERAKGMVQLATMALIKSMSGLAVSEQEAKRYEDLLATGSSDDIHATMLAAHTFMQTRSDAVRSSIRRIGDAGYSAWAFKQTLVLDKSFGTVNIKPSNYSTGKPSGHNSTAQVDPNTGLEVYSASDVVSVLGGTLKALGGN